MAKASPKYDEDLEKIMNEVDDYNFDHVEEEEQHNNVNVDDILNEDLGDQTNQNISVSGFSDRLNITDLYPPKLELKGLANSSEHPLDVVEKYERDISARVGTEENVDTKFLVMNYLKNNERNDSSVSYEVLETISNHAFPDKYGKLPSYNDWGVPKTLAICEEKYIALGTSYSIALVFDFEDSTVKKFGTLKEQEYGPITAMDLNLKDKCLVCGYESGHIVLWGILKVEMLRTIPPVEKSAILAVKFWKEGKNNLIVSNAKGIIYLYQVEYSFFQWKIDKKPLLDLSTQEKKPKSGKSDPLDSLPDGFFSIQLLKKDLVKNHPLSKHTMVAFGSMKLVLLLTIEPSVGIIYKFNRPLHIPDSIIPSLSWGVGPVPGVENNQHPVLAVSWGHEINLFQCKSADEDARGIKNVGYFYSEPEILHLEYISTGNILTYSYNKEFQVLNAGLFNTPTDQDNPNFPYANAIVNAHLLDPDIAFQIYRNEKTSKFETASGRHQRPILYFTNTIMVDSKSRSMYILGEKRMYIGRHFEWKEYMDKLVEDDDWTHALALFVAITSGTNRQFAGLPGKEQDRKALRQEYGENLIREYLQKTSKVERNNNSMWKTVALTVIDFLVSIESFNFLFIEVKNMFQKLDQNSLFLECLEPFILKNRIKHIPNEPFRDVVNYYSEKDKTNILQYLMINIEMHDLDLDFAISLCMDYNLITALFYLCSHKEGAEGPDFMTPVARALSMYQKSVDEDSAESQEYGMKFLWFVFMIIKGKMFPHGAIPDLIWEEKVKDMIVLIFEETHLELMLRIEPHVAFETLRVLFEPKLAMLIQSYDQNSIQLIADRGKIDRKSRHEANGLRDVVDRFVAVMNNKIQAQMLGLIYYCGKKVRKEGSYRNFMYYMVASLTVHLGYNVPDHIKWECLNYILENERDIPRWEIVRKKLDERDVEQEGDPFIEERNDLILGLIRTLEGKITDEDLETIRKTVDQTPFIDVRAYLFSLKQDYQKCFELYINQSSHFLQMKVFRWLDNLVGKIGKQRDPQLILLKHAVVSSLPKLVQINSERTRKVMINLGQTSDGEAIKLLEGNPILQLEFLKEILSQRDKGQVIPDDLLILHIKLLCQLEPKKVSKEVKKYGYPITPCLKICQEYNNKGGMAVFLEKLTRVDEALTIMLELFEQSLEKKLNAVEDTLLFDETSLTKKLLEIKKICLVHSQEASPATEKIWFLVLDKMIEIYRKYVLNNRTVKKAIQNPDLPESSAYQRFVSTYSDYISAIFDDMSRKVSVESIAQKLKAYKDLRLGDLRDSLLRMLDGYHFESAILKEAQNLVIEDNLEGVIEVYNKASTGMGSSGTDFDADLLDKVVLFECGHSFPKDCVPDNRCTICDRIEANRAQLALENFKRKGPLKQRVPGAQSVLGDSFIGDSFIGQPVQSRWEDKDKSRNELRHRDDEEEPATVNPKDERNQKYLRKMNFLEEKLKDTDDWQEDENLELAF